MKNVKQSIFTLILILLIVPVCANAETITNNNGLVLTEQEYNDFLKIYDSQYIMNMTEEKYNKLKELDFSDVTKATKYVETVYNPNLRLTTEKEITESEFENFTVANNNSRLADGEAAYETQVKRIELTVVGGTTWNHAVSITTWKGIPSVRSFDVYGFRGYGFDFNQSSQVGEQIYILNDEYTVIDYAWNGTNIQKHDNGFGISMNIVNSDISFLQLVLECTITPTIANPTIYASYQHAQTDVSLATSQNYTLGGAGLGSVFVFPYSTAQKYDGMGGVYIAY